MTVGENIRRLRIEANMTQEELAEKLDVVRSTVTQWERGWSQPRMGKVQQLAEVFNTTPAALVAEGGLPELPAQPSPGPRAGARSVAPVASSNTARARVPFLPPSQLGDEPTASELGRLEQVEVNESILCNHPHARATLCEDDSMDRVVPAGMMVVYDPDLEPFNGGIAIVRNARSNKGEVVLRRWYKGGNTLLLVADSHTAYEDIVLTGDSPVEVVGTVVWIQPAEPLA